MAGPTRILAAAIVTLLFSVAAFAQAPGESDSPTPAPTPNPCNHTMGCGGPGPCTPGDTCVNGICDDTCPSLQGYECGEDGKWWSVLYISTTCGTICGERAALYTYIEATKWIENRLCGKCPVTVYRSINTDQEVAEKKVPCTDDARPPKTTNYTLQCMTDDDVDEWSNPNGIADATPPGTRHWWDHDNIVDTGCPNPSRTIDHDEGCMQGNQACDKSAPQTSSALRSKNTTNVTSRVIVSGEKARATVQGLLDNLRRKN